MYTQLLNKALRYRVFFLLPREKSEKGALMKPTPADPIAIAPTSRQIKSRETIERILRATSAMLMQHGFAALTVTNICKAARVSNGTFFHYFKSKNGLLTYFLNEGFNQYLGDHGESLENICGNCTTFCQRIIAVYIEYARYCRHIGIDFISRYYTPENEALNRYRQDVSDGDMNDIVSIIILEQLYCASREGYILETCDVEEIERDLCTIIKGIIFDWCLSRGVVDMEGKIQQFLSIYMNSIVTNKFSDTFS